MVQRGRRNFLKLMEINMGVGQNKKMVKVHIHQWIYILVYG